MIAVTFRLPDDLHGWLTRLADQDHRSLNSEVVMILEAVRSEGLRPEQAVRLAKEPA